MRRKLASLALAAASVAGGVGLTASPASAHSFGAQGPAHTHLTGSEACTATAVCYRWILQNGAIMQGNGSAMTAQYGYVLVWCSYQNNSLQSWHLNTQPWGPYSNTGAHTYCQNPKYSGQPWSTRP